MTSEVCLSRLSGLSALLSRCIVITSVQMEPEHAWLKHGDMMSPQKLGLVTEAGIYNLKAPEIRGECVSLENWRQMTEALRATPSVASPRTQHKN
jgi:hypothetical protein